MQATRRAAPRWWRSFVDAGVRCRVLASDPAAVLRASGGALDASADPLRPGERFDLAWVDLPHRRSVDTEALVSLRRHTEVLVCFDANDETGKMCDLHVSAVGRAVASTGGATRLWGPRYAVVPHCSVSRSEVPGSATPRVLMGFGASDPAHLSEAALEICRAFADRYRIELLVGPLVPEPRRRALRRRAAAVGVRALAGSRVRRGALSHLTLGVFAFGQLALEALARRAPVALWNPSPEHHAVGCRLQEACRPWPIANLGWGPDAGTALAALFESPPLPPPDLPAPIDARGAIRIADAALEQLHATRARSVAPTGAS